VPSYSPEHILKQARYGPSLKDISGIHLHALEDLGPALDHLIRLARPGMEVLFETSFR